MKAVVPGGGAIVAGVDAVSKAAGRRVGRRSIQITKGSGAPPIPGVGLPGISSGFQPTTAGGATDALRRLVQAPVPGGNQMAGQAVGNVFGSLFGAGTAAGSLGGAFGGLLDRFAAGGGGAVLPPGGGMPSGIPGVPKEIPIVLPPMQRTTNKAAPGYVLVTRTDPMTGVPVTVQMWKEFARKNGFWKPRKKPILSVSESNAIRKADAARKKVKRVADMSGFKCVNKARR